MNSDVILSIDFSSWREEVRLKKAMSDITDCFKQVSKIQIWPFLMIKSIRKVVPVAEITINRYCPARKTSVILQIEKIVFP